MAHPVTLSLEDPWGLEQSSRELISPKWSELWEHVGLGRGVPSVA